MKTLHKVFGLTAREDNNEREDVEVVFNQISRRVLLNKERLAGQKRASLYLPVRVQGIVNLKVYA